MELNDKLVKKGLEIINGHKGKRIAYETYQKQSPEVAKKYLEFVAKNNSAQYIKWDREKQKFTT